MANKAAGSAPPNGLGGMVNAAAILGNRPQIQPAAPQQGSGFPSQIQAGPMQPMNAAMTQQRAMPIMGGYTRTSDRPEPRFTPEMRPAPPVAAPPVDPAAPAAPQPPTWLEQRADYRQQIGDWHDARRDWRHQVRDLGMGIMGRGKPAPTPEQQAAFAALGPMPVRPTAPVMTPEIRAQMIQAQQAQQPQMNQQQMMAQALMQNPRRY